METLLRESIIFSIDTINMELGFEPILKDWYSIFLNSYYTNWRYKVLSIIFPG